MEYCLAEPNINLFILGNIENFGFESPFQDVWFQRQRGKICGVALRHRDNLLIYSQQLDIDFSEALSFLISSKVRIVSGKNTVIEKILPYLPTDYPRKEMKFCELDNAEKLINETSEVAIATASDAMEIAMAYGQIDEFQGLYPSDVSVRYDQIVNRIRTKVGIHMFIRRDGKIVSHVNSAAETGGSGMIGGIMTLPEYRNQGFSSKVISALCKSLDQRKKTACLFHDNPTAASVFLRLGFHETNQWVIIELGHGM